MGATKNAIEQIKSLTDSIWEEAFQAGVVAERKRMAALFSGGDAVVVSRKTKSAGRVTPKSPKAEGEKSKRGGWANLTPEQREARIAKLREGQQRRRAAEKGEGPTIRDNSEPATPAEPVAAAEPAISG